MTRWLLDQLDSVADEIGAAGHFFLGLDFDGTLAPIVPDPADAGIPEITLRHLESLSSDSENTIAIVSGRALRDLRSRIPIDVILAGNHGLEVLENGVYWRHPDAAKLEPELHRICGELSAGPGSIPGALVEDKGLTAGVHYRNTSRGDVTRLTEMVNAVIAPCAEHFFLRRGREVLEILPRIPWDKGAAILRMLQHSRDRGNLAICYIGDDVTDECAFRALSGAITVRVCRDCPTSARFRLCDPGQVSEFLGALGVWRTRQ